MKKPALILLMLALPATPALSQVVTEMTPQLIDQAIAEGIEQRPPAYSLRSRSVWIEFDTPYLRLSTRAAGAPVADRSLATAEVLAPELRVTAAPEPFGDEVPAIKELTIVRSDGASVAPTSKKPFVEYAQSARRKKIAIRGVQAVFPLGALQPGARFRFVTSDGREQLLAPPPSWFTTPR